MEALFVTVLLAIGCIVGYAAKRQAHLEAVKRRAAARLNEAIGGKNEHTTCIDN